MVIEDTQGPKRVRRPLDLARFVLALVITAAIVLVSYIATDTAAGLDSDIERGASLLPSFVVAAAPRCCGAAHAPSTASCCCSR